MPSDPANQYPDTEYTESGAEVEERPPTALQEPMYAQPLNEDGEPVNQPPTENPLNTFVEQPRIVSKVAADAEQAHEDARDQDDRDVRDETYER